MKEEDNILHVQMFGGFSMTWNGKSVAAGNGAGGTQFVCLMQMLLHNPKQGVDQRRLEEALFAGREVQDRKHAMRSIIYNARKRLKKVCLPDAEYIRRRPGGYCWSGEIPVEEDAARMEQLYQEIKGEPEPEEKLKLCTEACRCYKGEFLGGRSGEEWIMREARRYREMFCSCMEQAVSLSREKKDYLGMEKLGLHAARVHPLENWETVTMEALVSSGRNQEAEQFYEDTVSMYMEEQGLRPSRKLTGQLQRLGGSMQHTYSVFETIQEELQEDGEPDAGGYLCSYPVFRGIYQMLARMLERSGQSVYLMLCTVVDGKGNPVPDGAVLEQLSGRLCDAIRHSVRRSDALNRYGKGQYLVLLLNTRLEDCRILQKRIDRRFRINRQRIGVSYRVKSVICTMEMERKLMN